MEAIVNSPLNNKLFELRTVCTYNKKNIHLYRYRFEPEHEGKLRTICHEKNITLIEVSKKNLDAFKAFEV
jgi:hypothetical protein